MTQTIEQVTHSVVSIVRKTEYPLVEKCATLGEQMPHVIHWQADRLEELEGEVKRLNHIIGRLQFGIEFARQIAKETPDNTRVRDGKVEVFCLGEWEDAVELAKEDDDAAAI